MFFECFDSLVDEVSVGGGVPACPKAGVAVEAGALEAGGFLAFLAVVFEDWRRMVGFDGVVDEIGENFGFFNMKG